MDINEVIDEVALPGLHDDLIAAKMAILLRLHPRQMHGGELQRFFRLSDQDATKPLEIAKRLPGVQFNAATGYYCCL